MAAQRTTEKRSTSERPKAKSSQSRSSQHSPANIAKHVTEQLTALTGREVEGVTSLERDDNGWKARVEVLESRRIPDSADILALYETKTDEAGEVREYRRVRRYGRGRTGDD